MTATVKLQRIGNSIRATIPKGVADALALKPGEMMLVDTVDDTVVLKKRRAKKISDFYGTLKESEGRVALWPTPEEIKAFWE
jgi:AbrB family looped-hinge helix DNA binding protein